MLASLSEIDSSSSDQLKTRFPTQIKLSFAPTFAALIMLQGHDTDMKAVNTEQLGPLEEISEAIERLRE